MIDHISLGYTDLDGAKKFYDAVLAPLGGKRMHDYPTMAGYGRDEKSCTFWIGHALDSSKTPMPSAGTHVCFVAADRPSVDAFYQAAIQNGATDDGKPGLRPEYHPNYYGAFVLDPFGHKIEACCHRPE